MTLRIDPADVIALIPAAGFGTRFPGQGSKEVHVLGRDGRGEPVLLIDPLLAHLRAGGVREVVIVTRPEKADIQAALGDGTSRRLGIHWLLTPPTRSSPHTLDVAHAKVRGAVVVLGFPDIVFPAEQPVTTLLEGLQGEDVDLVLGVVPTRTPQRVDVVRRDSRGVRELVIKPATWRGAAETWVMAAWRPSFSDFLHDQLAREVGADPEPATGSPRELFVGDLIQRFIDAGHRVAAVTLSESPGVDGGTPEGLAEVRRILGFHGPG